MVMNVDGGSQGCRMARFFYTPWRPVVLDMDGRSAIAASESGCHRPVASQLLPIDHLSLGLALHDL